MRELTGPFVYSPALQVHLQTLATRVGLINDGDLMTVLVAVDDVSSLSCCNF